MYPVTNGFGDGSQSTRMLPTERVKVSGGGTGGSLNTELAVSPFPVAPLTVMSMKTLVQAVSVVVTCPAASVRSGREDVPVWERLPPAQLLGLVTSEKTTPAWSVPTGEPSFFTVKVKVAVLPSGHVAPQLLGLSLLLASDDEMVTASG